MSESVDPILQSFFTEATDILSRLENDLEALHEDPRNEEILNSIFRSLHTLKGNSSFLDLELITKLAHQGEALLDKVRKKETPSSPSVLGLVELVVQDLRVYIVDQSFEYDSQSTIQAIASFLKGEGPVDYAIAKLPEQTTGQVPTKRFGTNVVRLDEAKFERMVNLVSELDLYRNALELFPEKLDRLGESGSEFKFELDIAISKLSHISRSLSSLVIGAKLVPVNQVFQRFPRVVKELAQKLGKEIKLVIKNGDAELDKSIVDAIADPMTHLMRNSADHGIETKEERQRRGKSPQGTITLNSYVEGNFVYIEITDDGRGIDPEKILAKAIEKGIVPKDKGHLMSEAQKLGLIFAPGFSTAEKVTDISGRGVGMDVVKSNINRLKGSVLINSRVGYGTTIQLRFPMSMVVQYSLFIDINGSTCGIPLNLVEESVDFKRQELLEELPMREPDKYVSLYSLRELLWGKRPEDDQATFHVLMMKGKEHMGFIVDSFVSIEEAVVQSVDSYIAALPGMQGASIRKDGTVSLVLNPRALISLAQKSRTFAVVRKKEKSSVTVTAPERSTSRARGL